MIVWKWLLALYFILLVCDGALRKWVWPELGVLVFAIKDAVLVLCLMVALISKASYTERTFPRMPAYVMALALLWCALILIRALPDVDSLGTLIGVRYYLISLPFVYLIYRLLSSKTDVKWLVGYVVLAALATGFLGAVQFYSPPDSLINRYAWSTMEDIAVFGGEGGQSETRARITSSFSYISTYASFLQFALCVLLAAAVTTASPRQRAWTVLTVAVVAVGMVMTGSRAVFLMLVFAAAVFVFLFPRRFAEMIKSPATAIFTVIIIFAVTFAAIDPLVAIVERTSAVAETYGEEEAQSRILASLVVPYHTMADAGPFGLGVGAAFLGIGELRGYGGFEYRFDEIWHDRVGIELGALTYLLVLAAKIFFVLAGMRVAVRASTFEVRAWATAMVVHQLMYVWTIPFYYPVASPLYFTSIAVILFLEARERRLVRSRQFHAQHAMKTIPSRAASSI